MAGHEANGNHLQVGEAIPVDVPQHLPVDELARLQRHVVVAQHDRDPTDGGRDCGEQFRETVARSLNQGHLVADWVEQVWEDAYPQRAQVTAFEDFEGIDDLVRICSNATEDVDSEGNRTTTTHPADYGIAPIHPTLRA